MPYSRSAQAALLRWCNSFPLESKVESFENVSDGLVLSRILEDIDPAYATKGLERNTSPSKWLNKKKNLETVYKSLLRYIQNHCVDLDAAALSYTLDLNAIAEHDDVEQTVKLLTIVLMAAVRGTNAEKYVRTITEFDASTQAEIAKIIKQMQEQSTLVLENPTTTNTGLPPTLARDHDLALEEEHANLFKEHATLKKNHTDFMSRFEHLQESYDELRDRSNETDQQLKLLQQSKNGDTSDADYVQSLKKRLQEAEDLIAQQEHQAEADRVTKERQQKEIASLKPFSKRAIELEDQVKELQIDNTELSKKANTVDLFRKKLESHTDIEKENEKLRRTVDDLEGALKEYNKIHAENEKLKLSIKKYQSRIEDYEGDIFEFNHQKKTLEQDLRQQEIEIKSMTDMKAHDEKYIQELQEQLRSGGVQSTSPTANAGMSLEDELEQSEDSAMNYTYQISKLKAENQFYKSNSGGAGNAALQSDLEESERKRKRLEEKHSEIREKHIIVQSQLQAIIEDSNDEKNEALIVLRRLYLEATQEYNKTKSRLEEITTKLGERDRELMAARTDLSAMAQEDLDALEQLKETHELISSSLQNDLMLIQSRHKALTTDFELQQSQLLNALISKDELAKTLSAMKDAVKTEHTGSAEATGREVNEDLAQAKKAKERLASLKEQTKKQEQVIQDLKRRLKIAEEGGADAQKAANDTLMKNLARESAMMATAWYDLSSRLQSNHVVLQRRQDAPKTLLNKQRQMVNATPRR